MIWQLGFLGRVEKEMMENVNRRICQIRQLKFEAKFFHSIFICLLIADQDDFNSTRNFQRWKEGWGTVVLHDNDHNLVAILIEKLKHFQERKQFVFV